MTIKQKNKLSVWERILIARHPSRPYTLDYIQGMFTDFIELRGDKIFGDDPALIGGFAKFEEYKIMVIGHQKGRKIEERQERNFGMAHPEGYKKALRLMRLAEKKKLPIITFIDTPGAYPGVSAEKRHIGKAIADNLMSCFNIKTAIISIVIGEGGSGGALGIGIADSIFMLENSYYSVISPEGCASILWDDSTHSAEAAQELKIVGEHLQKLSIVEAIIEEPEGGAHMDYQYTFKKIKETLRKSLKSLLQVPIDSLLENRYARFRKFGKFKS